MSFTLSDTSLSLRFVTADDGPLLQVMYASTRDKELKLICDWSEEQKDTFITQQFYAQHNYYKQRYKDADFYIIEKSGEAIGRLYIDLSAHRADILIVDITLMPYNRNNGTAQAF
jgi:hypothetical protein